MHFGRSGQLRSLSPPLTLSFGIIGRLLRAIATSELTTIANEEGTDKGTLGPIDAWPAHNYTDLYEAYLAQRRGEPLALLEIGLGVDGPNWHAAIAQGRNALGGASLRMWYRYLPNARIFGIDVNPATFLDNDRVLTGVVDQGDAVQLQKFLEDNSIDALDVVIDDGSHQPVHQQIAFAALFPHLAPGGLYFIEDLLNNGVEQVENQAAVLSTRHVFRVFGAYGLFPNPNALSDEEILGKQIDSIAFHCPEVVLEGPVGVRSALRSGWPFRRVPIRTRFELGTEALCVVRKKG